MSHDSKTARDALLDQVNPARRSFLRRLLAGGAALRRRYPLFLRRNLKHLLTARVKEVAAAAKEEKARATGRGRAEVTVEGKGNAEAALQGVALHEAAVRGVAEEEGINRVLIPNPACAFAPSDEGYLAYNTDTRQLHRLNPTAVLILELCDGTRDTATICGEVSVVLGPDGNKHCNDWIGSALSQHLVVQTGDAATPRSSESFASFAEDLRRSRSCL